MKTLMRVFSLLFVFGVFLSGCSQLSRILGNDPEEKLEGVERIIITPRQNKSGGVEVDVSVEYANTPPPPIIQTGMIIVNKNMTIPDASDANPSGIIGEANVLIGSFVITAGTGEGSEISQIALQDDIETGISLSNVFQNLRLESGGPADANGNYAARTQMGQTMGTIIDSEDAVYFFTPGPLIRLGANAGIVCNVYADIISSASQEFLDSVNSDPDGIILLKSIAGTGTSTNAPSGGEFNLKLQRMYVMAQGELIVGNAPASARPKSRILIDGSDEEAVLLFRTASLVERNDMMRFIITHHILAQEVGARTSSGSPLATLYSPSLYAGSEQIAQLGAFTCPPDQPECYADINLPQANPVPVEKNEEKDFTLKVRTTNWPSFSSGSVHYFSLDTDPLGDGMPAVRARGAGSAMPTGGPGKDNEVVSNPVTVRRAVPLVERLQLQNSTLLAGSTTGAVLGKFFVTSGGNQTRYKKWTFRIAWTDVTPSVELAISNFKLYRNGMQLGQSEYTIYDGLGTEPEHILSAGGNAVLKVSKYGGGNTAAVNAALVFGDASLVDMTGEEIIAQGSSNTYELKADILNAHQGSPADMDWISVTMLVDENHELPWTGQLQFHPAGVITVRPDANSNFVWSDYSASTGDHSSSIPMLLHITSADRWTQDWTDGLWVPSIPSGNSFLPLDSWILSK